jgi:hypothetical protein
MTLTFRTTRQAWLRFITIALSSILLGSGLTVLAALAVRLEALPAELTGNGLLLTSWGTVLAIIWAGSGIISRARVYLQIDDQTISGKRGRDSFTVHWRDVLAAQLSRERKRCRLLLVTPETDLRIGLGYLDAAAIWQLVQARVPPAALAEDAFQRSPRYQDWLVRRAQLVNSATPLQVRNWVGDILILGAVASVCIVLAVLIWPSTRLIAIIWLVVGSLILAGLPLIERVHLDIWGVHRQTLWRRYSLLWKDIQRIEFRKNYSQLFFYGAGEALTIPGPAKWPQKKRRQLVELLQAEIQCRQIEVRQKER